MLAKTKTCSIQGLQGYIIDVEVDIAPQLPEAFNIVGLPEKVIQESRERVRSAIINSGFEFPEQRITVSLAPADIRKTGTYYDLPVAIGILAASGQMERERVADCLFLGELALDGAARPTRGVLPMVNVGKQAGYRDVFVPQDNALEASLVSGINIYPVNDLQQLAAHLSEAAPIEKVANQNIAELVKQNRQKSNATDMSDIRGHDAIKRALCIAVAGGHNVIMVGPPGTGKTLLARAMANLLPPMTETEVLDVTGTYSIAGLLSPERQFLLERPFRAPHYTISDIALVGGGSPPKPGEITLASRGILFLDELPEFDRRALEGLRQPMEDKLVAITRIQGSVNFPANFMLVAAMNPCPCGFYQSGQAPVVNRKATQCACSDGAIERYRRRVSGPLLSRIDIFLDVPRLDYEEMDAPPSKQGSDEYRERVIQARQRQQARFKDTDLLANSEMGPRQIWEYCKTGEVATRLLKGAVDKFQMSGRTIHRTLKLARTIADLADESEITSEHLSEALGYRADTNDKMYI